MLMLRRPISGGADPHRLSQGAAHDAVGAVCANQQVIADALFAAVHASNAHAPRRQVDALSKRMIRLSALAANMPSFRKIRP